MTHTKDDLLAVEFMFKDDFDSIGQNVRAPKFVRMNSPFYRGERWAVRKPVNWCLTVDGSWESEPSPSNRDDAFYERCRFNSLEDAIAKWNEAQR